MRMLLVFDIARRFRGWWHLLTYERPVAFYAKQLGRAANDNGHGRR